MDSGYNDDGTIQLEMAIFLVDRTQRCHFNYWSSSRCPHITSSILASEVYAFSLDFNYGMSRNLLFYSMNIKVSLCTFKDSQSILDTVTASKRLCKLRLTNEMADIRRAYCSNEIDNIAWIRSSQNIADSFTSTNGNGILQNSMETGRLQFKIEQWVVFKADKWKIEKNECDNIILFTVYTVPIYTAVL